MVRRPNSIQNARSEAFSYLELIVSLAVVAIGIVGLMRLQLMSLRAADYSKRMTQAVCLAESKLQEAMGIRAIRSGQESGENRSEGMGYRWQREITPEPLAAEGIESGGELYQVRVNVSWEQGGGGKQIELSSSVAAGGSHAM